MLYSLFQSEEAMKRTIVIILCSVLTLSLFSDPVSVQASGETFIVTSNSDSGPGTLRQSLQDAQSGDIITFDTTVFPPTNPHNIILVSPLPEIFQGNLIIDASNAGVVIDGSRITTETNGLAVFSSDNVIRGLHLKNFTKAGIALEGGAQNNIIGGDRNVGEGPSGQGNRITGKGVFGIGMWGVGTSFNTIQGNVIGTDVNGSTVLGRFSGGIFLDRADFNLVEDNLIGGYEDHGVYIGGVSEGHDTIRGNYIGTDISGVNKIGTASSWSSGIIIKHSGFNIIGPANLIANNGEFGVHVYGKESVSNRITQNSIYKNGKLGIMLWEGANTQLTAPAVFDFNMQTGTVTGVTCPNCIVEVFSDNLEEGEIYEGQSIADESGIFTFDKGMRFTNSHLTTTATDAAGNTSRFSAFSPDTPAFAVVIQEGNHLVKTRIQAKRSGELIDNRISGGGDLPWIFDLGVRYTTISINEIEWSGIHWNREEFEVPPWLDYYVNTLHDNGIAVNNQMVFWDKANHPYGDGWPAVEGWQPEDGFSRFQTDEEIERYIEFVRFNVQHFKDRVQYYEFWNEPDNGGFPVQHIRIPDYIKLIKRVVPVIRDEYPEAKILVGSVVLEYAQDYFFELLKSDEAMSLIDGLVWHPMFGRSPAYHSEYYYNYPSIAQAIMDTASAHGFKGEYFAEAGWDVHTNPAAPDQPPYTDIQCAKYFARTIIMHRAMDIITDAGGIWPERTWVCNTVQNLCTLMDEVTTDTLDIQIQCDAAHLKSYSFSMPDGDKLIAFYRDNVAVDADPGLPAIINIHGFVDKTVFGIDVLTGFQQEMITGEENGSLVIRNLLVKDYPIILKITSESSVTEIGKSAHSFTLYQNYPNPFNPITTIRYEAPKTGKVSLTIHNVLGQKIKTLVNKVQVPGNKSIVWDGRDSWGNVVSSGIYVYKLMTDSETKTRKMLFLK